MRQPSVEKFDTTRYGCPERPDYSACRGTYARAARFSSATQQSMLGAGVSAACMPVVWLPIQYDRPIAPGDSRHG